MKDKIEFDKIFHERNVHGLLFSLTLNWVSFLGVSFEVKEGGGGKINPCLKLVRIMLQTWNLIHKYTHICSFK